MQIQEVDAVSHGVGGSYTKWQRKPPAHGTYRIHTPEGYGVVIAHVEVKIGDDEPSIVKIDNDTSKTLNGAENKKERIFKKQELEEIKEYLIQNVIPEEEFWSFNGDDSE